jgi:hypothetical protein
MERTENKGRFPLFHSKNCCCDGLWSLFHVAAPDSPTTKPEAPNNLGVDISLLFAPLPIVHLPMPSSGNETPFEDSLPRSTESLITKSTGS